MYWWRPEITAPSVIALNRSQPLTGVTRETAVGSSSRRLFLSISQVAALVGQVSRDRWGGAEKLEEGPRRWKREPFRLESFSSENLLDGRRVVRESPQGTRILAYVENGKITRYEAEGSSGNSRPVFPDETVRGRGRRRL